MNADVSLDEIRALLELVERPALIVSAGGETLLGNAAAAQALDRPESELAGRPVSEILELDDPQTLLAALRIAGGARGTPGEERLHVLRGGRPKDVRIRRLSPPGEPTSSVVLVLEAGSSPAGAAREDVAELAHALRQPVQISSGYAELLAAGMFGPLNERQQRAAKRLGESLLELGERLRDLLEVVLGRPG